MTTITDMETNQVSEICRTYIVQGGAARLCVGRDRKVWIGYEPFARFTFIGRIPAEEKISKAAACRAANCS